MGISCRPDSIHEAVVELDHDACNSIRANQALNLEHMSATGLSTKVMFGLFDFAAQSGRTTIFWSAGVPCQPWSIGGKHRGFEDERNLFPDTIRAVVALRPKAILIENVKGLTRQSFTNYFTYIQFMLEFPEVGRKLGEDWGEHRRRLERYVTARGKGYDGLRYNVVPKLINAANYGVPQRRERVFLVAFRNDLGIGNGPSRSRLIPRTCSGLTNGSPANIGTGTWSRRNSAGLNPWGFITV